MCSTLEGINRAYDIARAKKLEDCTPVDLLYLEVNGDVTAEYLASRKDFCDYLRAHRFFSTT